MLETEARQDLEAYRDEFRLVQNSIGGCGDAYPIFKTITDDGLSPGLRKQGDN